MTEKLQAGQKLWLAPNCAPPHWVTVAKVGRRFAHLKNGMRVDIESLVCDNGKYPSPGRCYLSRVDYERVMEVYREWSSFHYAISRMRVPDGVTVEDIKAARELLRIPVA